MLNLGEFSSSGFFNLLSAGVLGELRKELLLSSNLLKPARGFPVFSEPPELLCSCICESLEVHKACIDAYQFISLLSFSIHADIRKESYVA